MFFSLRALRLTQSYIFFSMSALAVFVSERAMFRQEYDAGLFRICIHHSVLLDLLFGTLYAGFYFPSAYFVSQVVSDIAHSEIVSAHCALFRGCFMLCSLPHSFKSSDCVCCYF